MEFALAMLTLQGLSVISVYRAFMVPVVLVRDWFFFCFFLFSLSVSDLTMGWFLCRQPACNCGVGATATSCTSAGACSCSANFNDTKCTTCSASYYLSGSTCTCEEDPCFPCILLENWFILLFHSFKQLVVVDLGPMGQVVTAREFAHARMTSLHPSARIVQMANMVQLVRVRLVCLGCFWLGREHILKGAFLLDCSCGVGATSISCDSTGTCNCQTGYATPNCSTCSSGYFGANCSGFFFLFLSLRFVFGCVPKKNLTINRSLWMWHWDSELQLQQYRGMYMQ